MQTTDMVPGYKPQSCQQQKPKNLDFTERNKNNNLFYPCLLFITIFFALQLLLVSKFWSFPISSPIPPPPPPVKSPPQVKPNNTSHITHIVKNECPLGKIYVYNLPIFFNVELLQNCHGLDPWHSFCAAVSNGGFGPTAADIAGVVPESLRPAWHKTHQFLLEVIFHNRLLKHKCRTQEPESATAFYMPFYAALALNKFLWYNCTAEEKDHHGKTLMEWFQDQPYYKRSNGSDHFIALGRITWDFKRWGDDGWGSSFLKMTEMQNVTRLLIEKDPWDSREYGVPYPTGFHPRSKRDVLEWQNFVRTRSRKFLFSFVGGKRAASKNDFRETLMRQCVNESCKLVECGSGGSTRCRDVKPEILAAFLDSDFCLQPRGDSYTRRSIFDCMVAGSIPVFFWTRSAYDQYQLFLPSKAESYSVFIEYNEVKNNGSMNIRGLLERFSREEVEKMRERVINLIPRLVYAKGEEESLEDVKDAFQVAVDGVLRRVKRKQEHRHS